MARNAGELCTFFCTIIYRRLGQRSVFLLTAKCPQRASSQRRQWSGPNYCFSNKSTCSAFAPRIKCVQFSFDVFSGLIVPTEPWGRWRRRPRASVLADGCAFCAALLPDDGGLFSNVRRLCFALIAADSRAHARVRSCCGLSLNAAEGYVSGLCALVRGPISTLGLPAACLRRVRAVYSRPRVETQGEV